MCASIRRQRKKKDISQSDLDPLALFVRVFKARDTVQTKRSLLVTSPYSVEFFRRGTLECGGSVVVLLMGAIGCQGFECEAHGRLCGREMPCFNLVFMRQTKRIEWWKRCRDSAKHQKVNFVHPFVIESIFSNGFFTETKDTGR